MHQLGSLVSAGLRVEEDKNWVDVGARDRFQAKGLLLVNDRDDDSFGNIPFLDFFDWF